MIDYRVAAYLFLPGAPMPPVPPNAVNYSK
jgi:hypothetical protein